MRRRVLSFMMIISLVIIGGCSNNAETTENETTTEEKSTDSYELMMSYVEQIQKDFTEEQVVAIMGEPHSRQGSGVLYNLYYFGEYEVRIVYCSDGFLLDIYNNATGELTEILP